MCFNLENQLMDFCCALFQIYPSCSDKYDESCDANMRTAMSAAAANAAANLRQDILRQDILRQDIYRGNNLS